MVAEYVEFPAMGLRIPVSRTLVNIMDFSIYTYAAIIAFAILLMIFLGLRHAKRYGISQDNIIDFMIFALPVSIICARLYYVVFSWDMYKDNLLQIFNIRQGGLALYGGVIGAFLTVIVFSKVKRIDTLRFFDFGVPYLVLAQAIGRWGNFFNQEAFGTNTTLPWGMTSGQISGYLSYHANSLAEMGIVVDPSLPVHPTFLYESIWNIGVAVVLFRLRGNMKFKGEGLLVYLIGYGTGRAIIEGMRTDSLMLGGFRISQLLSVAAVVVCAAVFLLYRGRAPLYEPGFMLYDANGKALYPEADVVGETAKTVDSDNAERKVEADTAATGDTADGFETGNTDGSDDTAGIDNAASRGVADSVDSADSYDSVGETK